MSAVPDVSYEAEGLFNGTKLSMVSKAADKYNSVSAVIVNYLDDKLIDWWINSLRD